MAITQAELTLHQERRGVIGGSDVGAIFNLDWGCKRRLFYEKSGRAPDFPQADNPIFERGHYMEEVIARMYADKTGRPVKIAPRIAHPSRPWMVVHMDRIVTAPDKAGDGYLEIKCVNRRTFQDFKRNGLKESYILQVQHGLAVTGYTWGSYAILCIDPWEFKWFDVERDNEIVERLYKAEAQFMSDVEHGAEYVRLPPTDKRCATCLYRHSCQGDALRDAIPVSERDAELVEMPELLPIAAELHELETMKTDAEEMIAEAKEKLMAAIESHATPGPDGKLIYPVGVRYPGGRALRMQNKGSKKWDAKALWALYEKGTPRLRELLGPYCNNGKEGKPPTPYIRAFWTGEA